MLCLGGPTPIVRATMPCAGPECRNDNILLSRIIHTDTRQHDISQSALHGAS